MKRPVGRVGVQAALGTLPKVSETVQPWRLARVPRGRSMAVFLHSPASAWQPTLSLCSWAPSLLLGSHHAGCPPSYTISLCF